MSLIQLTDALNDGDLKEYVDTESITNIQPRVKRSRRFGIFGAAKTEVIGSAVFTVSGEDPTYVKELPEQIVELINKSENQTQEQ